MELSKVVYNYYVKYRKKRKNIKKFKYILPKSV